MNQTRTLPVVDTVVESLRYLLDHRVEALRLAAVPLLLSLALDRLEHLLEPSGWALLPWMFLRLIAYSLPATWLLVPWYRRILLGEPVSGSAPTHARFLQTWLSLDVLPLLVLMPLAIAGVMSDGQGAGADLEFGRFATMSTVFLLPPVIYVYMRCYLAAPLAATGREGGYLRSWLTTSGNGWAVFNTQLLWYAPVLPLLYVASGLSPENPTTTESFIGSVLSSGFFILVELIFATVTAHIYLRLDPAAREPVSKAGP